LISEACLGKRPYLKKVESEKGLGCGSSDMLAAKLKVLSSVPKTKKGREREDGQRLE
jgi:hypothetical protein